MCAEGFAASGDICAKFQPGNAQRIDFPGHWLVEPLDPDKKVSSSANWFSSASGISSNLASSTITGQD
jgi:hypothetical protein